MRDRIEEVAGSLLHALGHIQGMADAPGITVRPDALVVEAGGQSVAFPRLPNGRVAMAADVYARDAGRLNSTLFFEVCDVVSRAVGPVALPQGAAPYLKTDGGIPGRSTRSILTMRALQEIQDLATRSAGLALRENGAAKIAYWHEGRHGVRAVLIEREQRRMMVCLSVNGSGGPTSVSISDVSDDRRLQDTMSKLQRKQIPDADLAVAFSPATVVKGCLDDMALVEAARHVVEHHQRQQMMPPPTRSFAPQRQPRPV